MKTEKVTDQIMYGDGVYVSALPVLVMSAISDWLDNLISRLVKRFSHSK